MRGGLDPPWWRKPPRVESRGMRCALASALRFAVRRDLGSLRAGSDAGPASASWPTPYVDSIS